jgi:hypothetical protein
LEYSLFDRVNLKVSTRHKKLSETSRCFCERLVPVDDHLTQVLRSAGRLWKWRREHRDFTKPLYQTFRAINSPEPLSVKNIEKFGPNLTVTAQRFTEPKGVNQLRSSVGTEERMPMDAKGHWAKALRPIV